MTYRTLSAVAVLALLLSAGAARSAPPKPDFADLPAYLQALSRSQDPAAKAIRRQIADGPAALARERAEAQKEGIAVFPAQLNRPRPPDDRNAAPLYVHAAALRKGRVRLPNYAETLSARYAYTPGQLDRVQKIYDDNPEVFALLRQATDRPQCVFAKDWTKDTLNLPFLTNHQKMRETARELKTESVLQAERGQYADAVVTGSRVYRVAAHLASGPTLSAYLTSEAIDAIATSGMQDILALAGPNADIDAQVAQAVRDQPASRSLRRALSSEAALDDASFSRLRRGGPAALVSLVSDAEAAPPPASAALTPPQRRLYANLLDAAEADYLHRMRRLVQAADTPGQAAAFARANQEAARQTKDPIKALANQFLDFRSYSFSEMLNVWPVRRAASRQITCAAAAVLAERAKTGAYPPSLPGTFSDPFTNRPLGYRREGANGFVVYSAGPDGTFSGGKPGEKRPPGQALFRYPIKPVPLPTDMLK